MRCGYRVCEICRELRCSERYLYEVAKRDIGLSPKAWMRGERMVKARMMLLNGTKIAKIADELGFSSTGSFSREFAAIHGTNPKNYTSATTQV